MTYFLPRTRIDDDPDAPLSSRDDLYFNRDLSWLEFNRRVLAQATDPREPLLERVKFLAIFSSNLDEFFMKRVGLLRQHIVAQDPEVAQHAASILPRVRQIVQDLEATQANCWQHEIIPALAESGICIVNYLDLDKPSRDSIDAWYLSNVFPVLTPLAVDPGHPFPFISNLSENIGVIVGREGTDERLFARIKIPTMLSRFVPVDAGTRSFIPIEQILLNNLDDLFPGMQVHEFMTFRVTRSAVTRLDSEDADDLLEHVETQLRMRRFASAVRVEVGTKVSDEVLGFISDELGLGPDDVYQREGPLDYGGLFTIADLPVRELKDTVWFPCPVPDLAREGASDIFSRIRERDILLHHPYESFKDSVERFIAEAARDPDVIAIKQTLYRTSRDSPFVTSLIRAAERGKQVACLVELRARFDEDKNVRFARQLEKAGVHVAYGVVGLKTHCKCSLVVRRETNEGRDALHCYAHLGTGNYHPKTAQLYTDIGLLTDDPDITADVVDLFNVMTGRARPAQYRRLLVAPTHMRDGFVAMINREAEIARSGGNGRIIAKMNALEDSAITDALYEASRAGVQIDLIVRGFCCLRPGVSGMSDNIRVRSVIGRFLEHSRIFYFGQGADDPLDGSYWFSSADWMYRNLSARVEAACPVQGRDTRARLWHILDVLLRDQSQAWVLDSDGSYRELRPPPDADPDSPEVMGSFAIMMADARKRAME